MWCCSFKRMLWTDRLQDFSPYKKKKFLHGLRGDMMAVFDSLPDKALKLHIRNTVRHDWHGRWSYSGGRTCSDRKCEQVKSLQRLTRRIVRRTAEVSPLCSVGSSECSSWMQERERRDWPGVEVEVEANIPKGWTTSLCLEQNWMREHQLVSLLANRLQICRSASAAHFFSPTRQIHIDRKSVV